MASRAPEPLTMLEWNHVVHALEARGMPSSQSCFGMVTAAASASDLELTEGWADEWIGERSYFPSAEFYRLVKRLFFRAIDAYTYELARNHLRLPPKKQLEDYLQWCVGYMMFIGHMYDLEHDKTLFRLANPLMVSIGGTHLSRTNFVQQPQLMKLMSFRSHQDVVHAVFRLFAHFRVLEAHDGVLPMPRSFDDDSWAPLLGTIIANGATSRSAARGVIACAASLPTGTLDGPVAEDCIGKPASFPSPKEWAQALRWLASAAIDQRSRIRDREPLVPPEDNHEAQREWCGGYLHLLECYRSRMSNRTPRTTAKSEPLRRRHARTPGSKDLTMRVPLREAVLALYEQINKDAPNRSATPPPAYKATTEKVGRNSPCPCGSGRKYKRCCLQ